MVVVAEAERAEAKRVEVEKVEMVRAAEARVASGANDTLARTDAPSKFSHLDCVPLGFKSRN